MPLPRLVLVVPHHLGGHVLRGYVREVRRDQPRLAHLLWKSHHGKQNLISATVLTENIKRRQVHPYLPTLPCLL